MCFYFLKLKLTINELLIFEKLTIKIILIVTSPNYINTYLCITAIYAYLAITNRILYCINYYVIRIKNCQISSL